MNRSQEKTILRNGSIENEINSEQGSMAVEPKEVLLEEVVTMGSVIIERVVRVSAYTGAQIDQLLNYMKNAWLDYASVVTLSVSMTLIFGMLVILLGPDLGSCSDGYAQVEERAEFNCDSGARGVFQKTEGGLMFICSCTQR